MVLEGVVTNVAAFGAFVDVGVHQDGLVHISAMANSYVKDPRKVAKSGDVVRVKVLEVELKRRRISLTMRLDESPATRPEAARTEFDSTGSEKSFRSAETHTARSNPVPASGDAIAEAQLVLAGRRGCGRPQASASPVHVGRLESAASRPPKSDRNPNTARE